MSTSFSFFVTKKKRNPLRAVQFICIFIQYKRKVKCCEIGPCSIEPLNLVTKLSSTVYSKLFLQIVYGKHSFFTLCTRHINNFTFQMLATDQCCLLFYSLEEENIAYCQGYRIGKASSVDWGEGSISSKSLQCMHFAPCLVSLLICQKLRDLSTQHLCCSDISVLSNFAQFSSTKL